MPKAKTGRSERRSGSQFDGVSVAIAQIDVVIASMPLIAFRIDENCVITAAAGRGLQRLGTQDGESVGSTMWPELYGAEDAGKATAKIKEALAGGQVQYEVGGVWNGKPWAYLTFLAFDSIAGKGAVGFAIDITEKMAAEKALRESEDRFRRLADNSPDVVFRYRVKPDIGCDYISPAVERATGYRPEDFYANPRSFVEITHPDDLVSLAELLELAVRPGTPATYRIIHKDGQVRWLETRLHRVLDTDGDVEAVEGVARDVTDVKLAETRLTYAATHDPLTGLANRSVFLDRLARVLAHETEGDRSIAVLFMDLDAFNDVNVRFGHEAGDDLLRAVGVRLGEMIEAPTLVARFGGDEFLILRDDVASLQDATALAQSVVDAMTRPIRFGAHEMTIPASVGIALATPGPHHPKTLIRQADVAMYLAKERGGSRYAVYEEDLRIVDSGDQEARRELGRAIEDDQLRVHYQPQVDLGKGQSLVALEALVRWDHPERGLLPPSEFIPLAEESGLIIPLGDWVLERACRDLARIRASLSPELIMHVNLSALQLRQRDLASNIQGILDATDTDPGAICFEITETAAMEDVGTTLDTLALLHALGVVLAIDDFGTGYSSLASLQQFPVDILKVDGRFVSGLGTDADARAIVETILSLTSTLKLTAVAEGVETKEQMAVLRALGCDHAQGFYFGRPEPLDTLLESL